jgi:hypothetical protein
MQVTLDKGSKDGIVVGSEGNVYSHLSTNGHERNIKKIGTGQAVSVEGDTALVHIQMESPEGDGLVRQDDFVYLKAITPSISNRSALWEVVKYNATFSDFHEGKIFDYRTLYSEDTPELEREFLDRVLGSIHDAGEISRQELDDRFMKGKPVSKGLFANKALSEALRKTTIADVNMFVNYLVKRPSEVIGLKMPVWKLYAAWVALGAPST